MAQSTPIDGCNPTILFLVVIDYPFDKTLIGMPRIIGIIGIEGEDETLLQLDPMPG
jgi:hypothetical protein